MTPCFVTDELRLMYELVVPCKAPTKVLESKTTLEVGLDMITEFVLDPDEMARVDDPPPAETKVMLEPLCVMLIPEPATNVAELARFGLPEELRPVKVPEPPPHPDPVQVPLITRF
jgi:hypothetical protein